MEYNTSGIYYFQTTNTAGCDSTATLVLTMNFSTEATEFVTECDEYEWNGEVSQRVERICLKVKTHLDVLTTRL